MNILDNPESPLGKIILLRYNNLSYLISQVPNNLRNKKKINGTGGLVSINNIISYQIGWGSLLIKWYTSGINKKNPLMPGDGFDKWDYTGLANHFYKKYSYDTNIEYDKKFKSIVKKILKIVRDEFINDNLDKLGIWQWCTLPSGKRWPLSKWIQVNTASPYKKALSMIQKFIKTSELSI